MENSHSHLQATCLANVSEDLLMLMGEACSNVLAPKALASLAATSRQILTMLRPKLIELRDFRAEVRDSGSQKVQRESEKLYFHTSVTR